jgi:CheY-like chemotaxis protein
MDHADDYSWSIVGEPSGRYLWLLHRDPLPGDAVITDYHMPGFNGVEVARRARERHPAIPVLFVSARTDLLNDAGAPEPYTALRKPFTMAQLSEAVHKLMDDLE